MEKQCFIPHLKKDTEKVVLLEVKGLIQVIVKFRTEKIFTKTIVIKKGSFHSVTQFGS